MQENFYLVIGSGSIARRHIKNIKMIFPESTVVCVSASGRPLTKQECSADIVMGSLEAALQFCRPEFAIVASPAPFHIEQALTLLREKIPTLIEKPVASNFSAIQAYVGELLEYAQITEVAYNLRYLPSAVWVKKVIDDGGLGRLHSVHIDVGQYLPDWRPQSDYSRNVSARSELGGGVLLELSHELDYLTWIFGQFETAYCLASQSGRLKIDVEDSADVILSRRDGLTATLHMDFLQRATNRTCKVIAEYGTLLWNVATNSVCVLKPGGECQELFADDAYDRNAMYLAEIERFARVARGELPPAVTIEEGLYILRLVDALKTSSQRQQAILIEAE